MELPGARVKVISVPGRHLVTAFVAMLLMFRVEEVYSAENVGLCASGLQHRMGDEIWSCGRGGEL